MAVGLAVAGAGAAGLASVPELPKHAPKSLEALMAHFASSGGVRAHFAETRRLSILLEPIETRGLLYFLPPDTMARVTTYPSDSTVVVRGTTVILIDQTGRREMDLATSTVARELVTNLAVLLRGDLAELRARYRVNYFTDEDRWQIDLEPRSRKLRALVERVLVKGKGRGLTGMETYETNGDATFAVFSQLETGLDFETGDGPDLFSLEAVGRGK